jgi:hypothetical protein
MQSEFIKQLLGREDKEANDRWFAYLRLVIDSTHLMENDRIQRSDSDIIREKAKARIRN